MSRLVTRAQIRTRVRQRSDTENDPHVTDDELNDMINERLTRLWDRLVSHSPPDYYTADVTFTTVANQEAYALPADFYKVRRVWQSLGTRLRPLDYVDDSQRHLFELVTGGESIRLRYIKAAPLLLLDTDTFDGVNGFEELVVLEVALDVLNKQERPYGALMDMRKIEDKRITDMAYRDYGSPGKIRRKALMDPYSAWIGSVVAYTVLGNTICVYKSSVLSP